MKRFRTGRLSLVSALVGMAVSFAAAADLVGTLPGEFSVDNRGAANYVIPLSVAPGINGMQPAMSLAYNSLSGNGPVGVGWTLDHGFPKAISRGRTILARDNEVNGITFTDSDKLYLDGKRLICVQGESAVWTVGSDYRTEVDSFLRITSGGNSNGIKWFQAVDKNGLIMHFGAWDENDNGTLANDESDAYHVAGALNINEDALHYALKYVEDTSGNRIVFNYTNYGNKEHKLASIDYAFKNNSFQSRINISYETRDDAYSRYISGKEFRYSRRVKYVDCRFNSTVQSRYDLGYEYGTATPRSRLISVDASLLGTSGTDSIPATTFVYSDYDFSDATGSNPTTGYMWGDSVVEDTNTSGHTSASFNDHDGDGLSDHFVVHRSGIDIDVYWQRANGAGLDSRVLLAEENGTSGASSYQWELLVGDFYGSGRYDFIAQLFTGMSPSETLSTVSAPLWGDGLDGVVVFTTQSSPVDAPFTATNIGIWNVYKDDPGDSENTLFREYQAQDPPVGAMGFEFQDFTGDGKPNYIETRVIRHGRQEKVVWLEVLKNPYLENDDNASLFKWGTFGDGIRYLGGVDLFNDLDLDRKECAFGDVNGDGLVDFAYKAIGGIWVCLNDGGGFLPPEVWISTADVPGGDLEAGLEEDVSNATYFSAMSRLIDMNGDGFADFLWSFGGYHVALSNGSSFYDAYTIMPFAVDIEGSSSTIAGVSDNLETKFFAIGNNNDINGDGLVDLAFFEKIDFFHYSHLYIAYHQGTMPDLLIGVENGMGSKTEIIYDTITGDSNAYTPGSNVSYPIKEDRSSTYRVVTDVYKDFDSGGNFGNYGDPAYDSTGSKIRDVYHFSYQYSGHRFDNSGRGDLGFHSFVTFDHQTNLFTYQFIEQSFPMTGLVKREQVYKAFNVSLGSDGSVDSFDLRLISSKDNAVLADMVVDDAGSKLGTMYPYTAKSIEHKWEDGSTPHYRFETSTSGGAAISDSEDLFIQDLPNDPYTSTTVEVWYDEQNRSNAPNTSMPSGF